LFVLIQNLPVVEFNPVSVLLLQLHHDIASSRNQSASGTSTLNQIFVMPEEFETSTPC
jgi:hypothetical protein